MRDQSPLDGDSHDEQIAQPTPAAGEALDLSLISASLIALIVTYAVTYWSNIGLLGILIALITDLVFVFLVVPHVVAYWLRCDPDSLLNAGRIDSDR